MTAAAIGSAVAGFILWVLGVYAFKGDVPAPVATLVVTLVTFVAGYMKRA